MKAAAIVVALGCVATRVEAGPAVEMERDTLPVPPVPAAAAAGQVELPAVPRFELPRMAAGLYGVRELRVRGRGLIGRELTVAGYVAWIYDCVEALMRPGRSRYDTRQLVEDHPELCDRPKFSLGAQPAALPDTTLWVVEVPRPPNKRERSWLTPKELEDWPRGPTIALGQLVAVTGLFARRAPGGDLSSDGLVVYRGLSHAVSPPGAPVVASEPTPEPTERVVTAAPLRVVVPRWKRNDSIEQYEACNAALVAGQLDAAIAACGHAIELWPGNHLAWYALGNAHGTRGDWAAARTAYDHSAALRPDQAMYQLYAGLALSEVALPERARADAEADARADAEARQNAKAWADANARGSAKTRVVANARNSAKARAEANARGRADVQVDANARDARGGADGDARANAGAAASVDGDAAMGAAVMAPYARAVALAARIAPVEARLTLARRALARAAAIAPTLWQAHYQLGRIAIAQAQPADAAVAFTRAIQAAPLEPAPYLALVELYRGWDLPGHAIAVARQGVTRAPSIAGLWYELGVVLAARQQDRDAFAAFDRAVAGGSVAARFQRGQVYLRRRELVPARRELEAFVAAAPPTQAAAVQMARHMLAEITRKELPLNLYTSEPNRTLDDR